MKRSLSALLIGVFALCASAQSLVINEIMQSNIDCIMDDLNEFPDSWMEIYNASSAAIDLHNYRVGLSEDFEQAYPLPQELPILYPGAYALVYCDKVAEGMHAHFRIDSGKGALYLFDPDGHIIDSLTGIKKQPAPNVAYGREADASDIWGYEIKPTPGYANQGGLSETVLGPVVFSNTGGVWNLLQPITLELSLPENAPAEADIWYTVDGSEPSPENGQLYSAPIEIKGNVSIKAKAVCEGCVSIPANGHSWIYMCRDVKIPVISIIIDNKYLYDNNIGIFADGYGGVDNENYRQNWRRPAILEMWECEGQEAIINQLCETRVHGGWTRVNPLKSMAMYANKRFGNKRFEYELWKKDKPGMTDNKSFVLRNGGNDYLWAYVRDGLIQRVLGRNSVNIDWQAYAPAIVCINGKYHAMLAIRERSNEDNIYSNYNGLEDIDMVENWEELKTGDWERYNEFVQMMDGEHSYDEWAEMINIDSYIDLMAMNYWVYNTDFPNNNTVMWRDRTSDDGRWRWLVKDFDFGLGIWDSWDNINKNFSAYMNSGTDDHQGHSLWKRLFAIPEFKARFADRIVAYCGDFLNARTFLEYLDEICEENHGEQKTSHMNWRSISYAEWSDMDVHLQHMRSWIETRQEKMPRLLRSTFSLGSQVVVKVNPDMDREQAAELGISYNGVTLQSGKFDGVDFTNRTIQLDALPESGIQGWKVQAGNTEAVEIEGRALSYEVPSTSFLNFWPLMELNALGETGIGCFALSQDGNLLKYPGYLEVYDLMGRKVAEGNGSVTLTRPGIYIAKHGTDATKVVF